MTIIICGRCKKESLHEAKGMCKVCYTIIQLKKNPENTKRHSNKYRNRYEKAFVILKNRYKKEFIDIMLDLKKKEIGLGR